MKMTKARLVLVVTLLLAGLCPTPAYAHAGWWDWLDSLSGPGPFNKIRPLFDVRIACAFDGQPVYNQPPPDGWVPIWYVMPKATPIEHARLPCMFSGDLAHRYLEVRVGWIASG